MKVAIWIVVGVVALYLIGSIIAGNVIISIICKAQRHTYESTKAYDCKWVDVFEAYEHEWERHPFEVTRDGVTLKCEYVINPDAELINGRRKVVILCHGHTAVRASMFKYAMLYYKRGYNLVIFDERYFGESTANVCTLGQEEHLDIVEIYKKTKEIFGEDAFVAMHGESMGSASELLAQKYIHPDFVVADCGFANTEKLLLFQARHVVGPLFPGAVLFAKPIGLMRAHYHIKDVNPIEGVRAATAPICFITGGADKLIPPEHSKQMYEASTNPLSELHFIDGADHAQSIAVDSQKYEEIVANFINICEKSAITS